MSKTYLEYVDEKSSKFWEIEINGNEYTVRYGKIGTDGRVSTKTFDSADEAQKQADKAIASKRKKGYTEPAVENPAGELTTVDAMTTAYPELEEFADGLIDMVETATIYRGDVILDQEGLLSLALEQGEEGTLLVIDGNLICTSSQSSWGDREEFSNDVILVTGNVTLNALELDEVGVMIIKGDLSAKYLFVHHGDNGGCLSIEGNLNAEVVISTTYFVLGVDGAVNVTHVISDSTYASDFAQGMRIINTYEDANVFVEALQDDDEIEEYLIYERLVANEPIFVNDGKPRDGAYDKSWS